MDVQHKFIEDNKQNQKKINPNKTVYSGNNPRDFKRGFIEYWYYYAQIAIFMTGKSSNSHFIKIIITSYFIILIFLYFFPKFLISTIVFIRTRHNGFLFELLTNISILALLTIIIYDVINNYPNIFVSAIYIALILIYFYIRNLKYKRPLFKHNNLMLTDLSNSDFLQHQTSLIVEFENGFSSRPVYIDLHDVLNENLIHFDLKERILKYSLFLAKNGELIGTEIENNVINMHIRTLIFINSNFFKNLHSLYKLLYKIFRKYDLTTITINLESLEMYARISNQDYETLRNVSYHILTNNLLEKFKISLTYYLANNHEKSLYVLNPS